MRNGFPAVYCGKEAAAARPLLVPVARHFGQKRRVCKTMAVHVGGVSESIRPPRQRASERPSRPARPSPFFFADFSLSLSRAPSDRNADEPNKWSSLNRTKVHVTELGHLFHWPFQRERDSRRCQLGAAPQLNNRRAVEVGKFMNRNRIDSVSCSRERQKQTKRNDTTTNWPEQSGRRNSAPTRPLRASSNWSRLELLTRVADFETTADNRLAGPSAPLRPSSRSPATGDRNVGQLESARLKLETKLGAEVSN